VPLSSRAGAPRRERDNPRYTPVVAAACAPPARSAADVVNNSPPGSIDYIQRWPMRSVGCFAH